MKSIATCAAILCLVTAMTSGCKKDNSTSGGQPATPTNPTTPTTPIQSDVAMWLTQPDQAALLAKQNRALNFGTISNNNPTIIVDDAQVYQTIDGFGFCLTGGSASLINSLPSDQKDKLLNELFTTTDNGIGISYIRISIGASDLSANTFTYDDPSFNQTTDIDLKNFTIDQERTDLIPILKKIVALNPSIKILGSPWTAPIWMKSNNSYKGGSLLPQYYDAYARYFLKYIQAMKAEGITIDAITPQNEPLNPYNNPSMVMQADEEANFIKNNLGPAFKAANINTKIIAYDHNTDRTDYPLTVLSDSGANPYVDGSAFHLYSGSISALTPVHDAYPAKNIYFTEQWIDGKNGTFAGDLQWHVNTLIIGATRNWSRNVIEWNLAADQNFNPHTAGGCSTCQGAITISPAITRNVSYYIIAHASKFVPAGSTRIASNTSDTLPNVAFKTPDGKKVLIVLNTNGSLSQSFNISYGGKSVTAVLGSGSVATFVW